LVELHPDRIALVRYHTSDVDPFYLYNPEEVDVRQDYYNCEIAGYIFVDGADGGFDYLLWQELFEGRMGVESNLEMQINGDYNGVTREVNLFVTVTATGEVSQPDLRLFVVLTESGLEYEQREHNQVMRDMIPDAEGESFTISNGETLHFTRDFTLDNQFEDENCEIAVFVQSYTTKEVLQSAKSGLIELEPLAVSISCENLSPWLCRGKNFYFKLTVTNNTGGNVSGTLRFVGYAGYDCRPGNILATIPRAKTFGPGVTEQYYFFKVPNAAGPGQYSASVGGTLSGYDLFCCMNTDIVQCSPFRTGDNTEWDLVEVDGAEVFLPSVTELDQNYPNPFNATTNISYSVAEASNVNLEVYDISGRLVETLVEDFQEAGQYTVTWQASGASTGIYFYKLKARKWSQTRRMLLMR
jgi:hypothetical protein